MRPDAAALAIETSVKARTVRLVLSSRWRETAKLEGVVVEHPEKGIVIARGSAVLQLEKLHVEASEWIKLTFLADHENLLLYAKDVELFKQQKGYGHKTENVDAVTMANDAVSIFTK